MSGMRKRCSACREFKPVSEFNARRASADGLQNQCRPCNNAACEQWHFNFPGRAYLSELNARRRKEAA